MTNHLNSPEAGQLSARVNAFYAEYAAALDDARYDDWLALFTEDCHYKLQPRENADRGLPLATLAFESRGMLADRIYGVRNTLFHQPYYQRHVFGPHRLVEWSADKVVVEFNYAVFRTKVAAPSEVFNVGKMRGELIETPDGLKLQRKWIVFDSELIANSIIYPI